jgi:cytochrome bd-type quinol oxidase subunit 2
MLSAALALVVLNVSVSVILLRSKRMKTALKAMSMIAVWIFPFVGAVLALLGAAASRGKKHLAPYPVNDPKIPGTM